MKSLLLTAAFAFILAGVSLTAQNQIELYNPVEFTEKAYAAINEEENYVKAAELFSKIHRNDSLYNRSLYNQIVCHRLSGNPQAALDLIDESVALQDEFLINSYLNKVYCLDSLDRKAEAYAMLDKLEMDYPYNYVFKTARAKMYIDDGKYKEALEIYKICIRDEPLNANHHYNLSNFARNAGGITHAILPLVAGLALDPEGANNLNNIRLGNYIVTNKPDKQNLNYDLEIFEEDFSDIDHLIGSFVGLDESYIVPGVYSIPIVKQFYLAVAESEMDKGFFSEIYLKPFKQVVKDQQFDLFASLFCMVSPDEAHSNYVNQNIEAIRNLNSSFRNQMDLPSEKRDSPAGLSNNKVDILFRNDGTTSGICEYDEENDNLVGPAIFFNEIGGVDREGAFDAEGEMTGDWTWYYKNGQPSRTAHFEKGKAEGESIFYNERGVILRKVNFTNGLVEGVMEDFKLLGFKSEDKDYKQDKQNGKMIGYYPNQSIHYEYQMKDDMYHGPFTVYYENGSIKSKGKYIANQYEGVVENYFRNGQQRSLETYKKGVLDGQTKFYYEDGKISFKGVYKDGNKIGVWEEYSSSGALTLQEEYDERGKVSGSTKLFDHMGRLETEYVKKKGEVKELINYNVDGDKISTFKLKGNNLNFKNLNVHGILNSEGQFVDNKSQGEWRYYDDYGNLSSIINFENDLKSGETKTFANGNLYSIENYQAGLLNGPYTVYFPDGSLRLQASYKNGELEGRYLRYTPGGKVEYDSYYVQGQEHGEVTSYNVDGTPYLIEQYQYGYLISGKRIDPNGEISSEITYTDGKGNESYYFYADQKQLMGSISIDGGLRDGENIRYHNNGKTRSELHYINGQVDGPIKDYYFNGNVKREGAYSYGDPVGHWQKYDVYGNKIAEYDYFHGRLNGSSLSYHSNGQISQEEHYNQGYLQGPVKLYNYSGELQIQLNYENGVFVSYQSPQSDGKMGLEIEVPIKGTVEAYFPNGQKSISYEIENGHVNGEYLSYFSNGQIESKSFMKKSLIDGVAYSYYVDGTVRDETNYVDGFKEGEAKYYYPNGKLKRIENWLYDELHGMYQLYDENENLTKSIRFIGNVAYDDE